MDLPIHCIWWTMPCTHIITGSTSRQCKVLVRRGTSHIVTINTRSQLRWVDHINAVFWVCVWTLVQLDVSAWAWNVVTDLPIHHKHIVLHTWSEKYNEMIRAVWEFGITLYGTATLISGCQHDGDYDLHCIIYRITHNYYFVVFPHSYLSSN